MKTTILLISCLVVQTAVSDCAAAPGLKIVRAAQGGTGLLANGDFEPIAEGRRTDWRPAPKGFELAPGEGRDGSQALRCVNPSGNGWYGASQSLRLNRPRPAPLVVRGWSKADKVSGGADNNYSIYVDLLYADGTPLWGQTGNFRCGTHDWEQREFVILPDKPVQTLTLHCLFRGHAGTVWFDDVSVMEVQTSGHETLFQGLPVQYEPATVAAAPSRTVATTDGLRVSLQQEQIVSIAAAGSKWARNGPTGFLARDVAADSDFRLLDPAGMAALGLSIEDFKVSALPAGNGIVFQGRVSSQPSADRALTLVYGLPVGGRGWVWGDDIRRQRKTESGGEFVHQVSVRCGSTGTLSVYPLAAIWNERTGLALGLDLAQPAVCRIGFHRRLNMLFVAYDFGLAPETRHFPGSAEFRFVLFRFDPQWGFRAAWQKYMEIFPEYFQVRAKEQGIWMPFTDVRTVAGWEDFGFKFHEGNNNVPWDDAHGIRSFRYTEPMTWWMPMPKGVPRTAVEAIRLRDEMAQGKNARHRRLAVVSRVAGMFDEAGAPRLIFRNTPWCDGAVWSLNPNPHLNLSPRAAATVNLGQTLRQTPPHATEATTVSRVPTNAATVYWNPAIQNQLYGPQAKGRLDGEYLDSLEGYVTAPLNFRRDHFRDTTVPLTFDSATKRPALFKGLAVFEFTRWLAAEVHRLGKLMFANGVPYRFACLCPWLDVMGTETDWLRGGRYRPASLPQMDLWRTLSGAKPYLLLMNTDYDRFTPDRVEKYFQRALFYGMFPSMFSHNASEHPYWKNPRWYNRDRHLFRQYIPVIRRVAEAGWQPVTFATMDNDQLRVERFGPAADGQVFFTIYNDSAKPQAGLLQVQWAELGLAPRHRAVERLSGASLPTARAGWRVQLASQAAAAVELVR